MEFVSRGAKEVVSVDNNQNSIRLTKQNFEKAKEKLNIIKSDFKTALSELGKNKYNYIFLDPPYNTTFGEEAINLISSYNCLAKDGLIIYEHLVDKEFQIPSNYEIIDTRKYGTIAVTFIKQKEENNA